MPKKPDPAKKSTPKKQPQARKTVPRRAHNPEIPGSTPGPATTKAEIANAAAHGYPCYVYTLADATGVFYVGKGRARRLFQHGRVEDANYAKRARLAASPGAVASTVVAYFAEDGAALAHEAALMAATEGLTNIAPGRVDPREAARDRAKMMLAQIVPFERSAMRTKVFDWSAIGFGSAREFYDASIALLEQEVISPSPTSFIVTTGPDGRHHCRERWGA